MKISKTASLAILFSVAASVTTAANAFDMGDMRGPMKGDNWGGMPDGPSNMNFGGPSAWGMPNNMDMGNQGFTMPNGMGMPNGNGGNPYQPPAPMPWGGNNWNNPGVWSAPNRFREMVPMEPMSPMRMMPPMRQIDPISPMNPIMPMNPLSGVAPLEALPSVDNGAKQ